MKDKPTAKQPIHKCPECGGPCTMEWSGLDLVANTGDETLASKYYTAIIPEKTNSELRKEGLLKNMLHQIEGCIENPKIIDWPALLNNWKGRIKAQIS